MLHPCMHVQLLSCSKPNTRSIVVNVCEESSSPDDASYQTHGIFSGGPEVLGAQGKFKIEVHQTIII
jgi:hypothetical protein